MPRPAPFILAIEASSTTASLALLAGDEPPLEWALAPTERSARALAPAIRDLLAAAGHRLSDVGLIAVTLGPGSFTSLRVGVTTAKTLAYAVGADLIGVGSLEALAAQAPAARRVSAGIDAGRGQVYAGRFDTTGPGLPRALEPIQAIDLAAWQATLGDDWVTGPILAKLGLTWPIGLRRANEADWDLRAATVGRLAGLRHQAGARDDLWRLAPLYVRTSAAEERRAARDPK
jgi:tRNA threonylcarbamoyladenosine biosynthesis protein TsaB